MKSKKIIAMLLCAVMVVSLLPVAVFADGEAEEIIEVVFDAEESAAPETETETEEETSAEDETDAEAETPAAESAEGEESAADEGIPAAPEAIDTDNEYKALSGTCGAALTFSLTDSGKLTIKGTGDMYDYNYNAPWKGKASTILSVSIEEGVTGIGSGAFAGCSKLSDISIASSVTRIGGSAFSECYSLAEIVLPDSMKVISSGTFEMCMALEKVVIPEGVESIETNAFYGCIKLPEISIPASVTSISTWAFSECRCLTAIKVAGGNKNYKSVDGVLFTADGKTLQRYPQAKTGSYAIPKGTEIIGDSAFSSCTKLKVVTVPASVTAINKSAFGIDNLENLMFMGNAPEFNAMSFEGATATAYYPAGNKTWTAKVMQQYCGTITWKPYTPPHEAPVISSLANHADYMIVTWNKIEGAVSYQLAYREGSGAWQFMDVPLYMVDSKGNPRVNLKNLKQGATYTFIAYALFEDGTKTKSESATQTRLLSPNVTAKAGVGYVNLTWNSVEGGSQYKIYYREKGGSWQLYAWVKKDVTSINVKESVINANGQTPLIKGHTYEFAVILGTSVAGITSGFPTTPVSVKY